MTQKTSPPALAAALLPWLFVLLLCWLQVKCYSFEGAAVPGSHQPGLRTSPEILTRFRA